MQYCALIIITKSISVPCHWDNKLPKLLSLSSEHKFRSEQIFSMLSSPQLWNNPAYFGGLQMFFRLKANFLVLLKDSIFIFEGENGRRDACFLFGFTFSVRIHNTIIKTFSLFTDYANRGKKKFGDKCESTWECGFPDSICDSKKRSCQCMIHLPVTNHIDKCGRGKPIMTNNM